MKSDTLSVFVTIPKKISALRVPAYRLVSILIHNVLRKRIVAALNDLLGLVFASVLNCRG